MDDGQQIDTGDALEIEQPAEAVEGGEESQTQGERDYEAEARHHGWTPREEFKGDPAKWVDARTFVTRADEVMPFLKKQNAAQKREIEDLKRQFKRAQAFFSKSEERAYQRALADLESRHDEAVETGDVAASKRIRQEIDGLKEEVSEFSTAFKNEEPEVAVDQETVRREFSEWIEANDWYVTDDAKRRYADFVADQLGPAESYGAGRKAWFAEIEARVGRKFTERKASPVNGGGNRAVSAKGGKTYADLPQEAKAMCDKWIRSGLIASREEYVKAYEW